MGNLKLLSGIILQEKIPGLVGLGQPHFQLLEKIKTIAAAATTVPDAVQGALNALWYLIPTVTSRGRDNYPHLTAVETEAPRGEVAGSGSHSEWEDCEPMIWPLCLVNDLQEVREELQDASSP